MSNETTLWQRAEGALTLIVAVMLFRQLNGSWLVFALLFFVPDASMSGYLAGPRVGAHVYNVFHNYALPLALGALGLVFHLATAQLLALIWTAHIGLDRLLGFGLKLPSGFGDTHLGISKGARRA